MTKSEFGSMPDGTKVEIYTLEEGALKARVMTYGARLVSLNPIRATLEDFFVEQVAAQQPVAGRQV